MKRAFVASLLLLGLLLFPMQPGASAEVKGAYTDEIQFIHYLDESVAVQEVKTGNLDVYFWRMPLELVPDAKQDPRVRIYESTGGSQSILLNPAPSDEGLNPFSIREVRFAMNYLINRQLIVNEVLKGFGTPMFSAFSIYEPDYLVLLDTIESFGFSYNPQLANKMISEALTAAGAVKKEDGRWFYDDKPIVVKFLIRSDDPRRNALGELVASDLEKFGITVSRDFGDLNKAFTVVYGDDPCLQEWHLYTEGWGGRAGFVRYDSTNGAQMYAPWFGNMPGFQVPEWCNYENPEIDEVTQNIFIGNFTNKGERDQLLNDAVRIGIEESVRIFVASLIDPYITSADLDGVVNDFSAGVTSRFTMIDSRAADERNLKIGVKQIYQGAWNPVSGFRDVYASRIWMGISDPGTFRYPHTGNVLPVRTPFEVETAGPQGKLDVPADAILWDPVGEKWVSVGEGANATSKATYDLIYSNWHHGVGMDRNDILNQIYFQHEWGTYEGDDDLTVDPDYTARVEPVIETIRGYRLLPDDKLEIYFDYWHFDRGEIGDYGAVWTTMPWEIYAAMERTVLGGGAAFSKEAADTGDVDWLSLMVSNNAQTVKDTLQEFKQEAFIPEPLKDYVSREEAMARYDSAIGWIEEKNHAVISNGPFYLKNYNPEGRSITIKAFRDDSYPYEQGRWEAFEKAELATIRNVSVPLTIARGSEAVISGNIDGGGDSDGDGEGDGSAVVSLYYFLKNGEGKVMVSGDESPAPDGRFQIRFSEDSTSDLTVGSYELKLLAISDRALRPDVYSTSLIALEEDQVLSIIPDAEAGPPQMDEKQAPSGCLIATAAFGSELSPQVQFLRSFRDDRILSTAAGSSFMNVFNAWYYSFSPQVADYERENPWMQQAVRTALYPLIGILLLSEKTHASFTDEYGAVAAGLIASFLIGALYFSPFALAMGRARSSGRFSVRFILLIIAASGISLLAGIILNYNNNSSTLLLMTSSAVFVLSTVVLGAMLSARALQRYVIRRIR